MTEGLQGRGCIQSDRAGGAPGGAAEALLWQGQAAGGGRGDGGTVPVQRRDGGGGWRTWRWQNSLHGNFHNLCLFSVDKPTCLQPTVL